MYINRCETIKPNEKKKENINIIFSSANSVHKKGRNREGNIHVKLSEVNAKVIEQFTFILCCKKRLHNDENVIFSFLVSLCDRICEYYVSNWSNSFFFIWKWKENALRSDYEDAFFPPLNWSICHTDDIYTYPK